MRKKLLTGVIITGLIFSLSGCLFPFKSNVTIQTETTSTDALTTEDLTTEDITTENSSDELIPTNGEVETFNNVEYTLPDGWSFAEDRNGTRLYVRDDKMETIAIYVQNEVGYTAQDLQNVYEEKIFGTFGNDPSYYRSAAAYEADLYWNIYSFGPGNESRADTRTDVYFYTDGDTTIYIENSFPAYNSVSDDIKTFLDSIVIVEE